MDFSKFEQVECKKVVILHPITGEETDASITVYSKDSRAYRQSASLLARGEGGEDGAEFLLAGVTKEWENIEIDGKTIEFNQENAIDVYKRFPFIIEQLERVVFDRLKFMKAQAVN